MIEVSIFLIRLMPRYCLFIYFISRIIAIMFGISFLIIFSVCYYWLLYLTLTIISTGFPGGTGGKEPTCQCRRRKRCRFDPWVGKIPWRRDWQPTPVFLPGEYNGRGAWWATVHRVTKSRTQLKWLSTLTSGTCIIGFYGALPLFKIIVVKSMVKWFTIVTIFKV